MKLLEGGIPGGEAWRTGTLALLLTALDCDSLPAVVTCHSDVIRKRMLKPMHAVLARRVLHRVPFIHVPTEAHIENSGILPEFAEKIRAIPFIIDVDAMRRRDDGPLSIALRKWAGDSALAVFVGRLVYYKGIDVLLDALSRTRRLSLVVVGDGPLRDSLKKRAAGLGITDRVRWLGTVGDDDVVAALSAGDFLALPSVARSEAFGLIQVEAMAAGLPVVSTRLGTSVEVVNIDGKSGLVVRPNDPAELAQAMQTLAEDASLRRRLAAGALTRAEDFAEPRLIGQYRQLYADARAA